ncbi:MAG: hypothetical protein GTO53_11045 [Planctomycetales bacterium]|nr:hypothetical protein [Planctomycetales bacterium]NIM09654.1 hypothetical protein [Planctomycetales bacterium]NIN09137.1 hypothetical protein [Planctomycetales bacterium]NIN78244.1 hypothetical protein [Planctomycetales bacterium]NIO35435.1 hypothetical protein [Planctomycetales bacterium]
MWQHERQGRGEARPWARRRTAGRDAKVRYSLGMVLLVCLSAGTLHGETWTDNTGKFEIEATFVRMSDDAVFLEKTDGKQIKVPLKRLSPESQAQARRLSEAQAPAAEPGDQPAGDGDDPAAALQTMITRLASGDLKVMWDSLPASYQKDVTEVVHTFAEHMDAEVFQAGATILQKFVQLLQEKKEFILKNPTLAAQPEKAERAAKHWDAAVDLLDAIINSELTDLEKLKDLDMDAFVDGTLRTIGEKGAALSEALEEEVVNLEGFPGIPVDAISEFDLDRIKVVDVQGDTATLKIEVKDGEVTEVKLVRVDGKWLPKDLVDSWSEAVQEVKMVLAVAMKPGLEQAKAGMLPMLGQVESVLDKLLAAPTNEVFDAEVMQLMTQFGPMLGAVIMEMEPEGEDALEDDEDALEDDEDALEGDEAPAEEAPEEAPDEALPF